MTASPAAPRRLPGRRRGVAVAALALAVAALVPASASSAPAAPGVPRAQPLVVLLKGHIARSAPNSHARRIEAVASRRPLTGVRTILPVLASAGKDDAWLRVRLPGRPNGHAGWISANRTRSTSTEWRIQISLSARRVTVFHDGRGIRRFRAVVGKPSTPTPRGSFFVEEGLALSPAEAGSPYALATSARSNVLQEFEGGPGQIAMHGTRHLSGSPGSAASHGCIRLDTRAIVWLARRIGAGVPLTIGK